MFINVGHMESPQDHQWCSWGLIEIKLVCIFINSGDTWWHDDTNASVIQNKGFDSVFQDCWDVTDELDSWTDNCVTVETQMMKHSYSLRQKQIHVNNSSEVCAQEQRRFVTPQDVLFSHELVSVKMHHNTAGFNQSNLLIMHSSRSL